MKRRTTFLLVAAAANGAGLTVLLLAVPAAAGTFDLVATHPDAAAQATPNGQILNTLKPFNGKLYAGYGDYGNNTGPIGIRAFDPATAAFTPQLLSSQTEAVLMFREINGKLYAPNIDPYPSPPTPAQRTGYALGTRSGTTETWADVVPIAAGHMFDIATFDGNDLWLAGTDAPDAHGMPGDNQNAQIWRSTDGGTTWQLALHVPPQRPNATIARFYAIHKYNGKLYAQAHERTADGTVLGLQPTSKVFDGTSWSNGPSLAGGLIGFPWHPETFAGQMVYQRNHGGINMGRLFRFNGIATTLIDLPGETETIYDYTISDGVAYALTTDGRVLHTADLINWTLLDQAPANARSLGVLNDTLYVGGTAAQLWQYTITPSNWNADAGGNWSAAGNWDGGGVPNAPGAIAILGAGITQPRTITVDAPHTVGQLRFDNTNAYTIAGAGAGALTLDATIGQASISVVNGSHTISAPLVLANNTTITVTPAASTLAVTGALTATGVNVAKAGDGRLDVPNVRAAGLSVNAGTVRVAPNGTAGGTSRVGNLTIAGGTTPTAKLDITNNAFVVDYTAGPDAEPFDTVKAQIVSGYNNGSWDGNGITSSSANGNTHGIGYAESSSLPGVPTIFGTVDGTAVLVRLTRYGDANLDAAVNLADFNRLAANFGSTSAVWTQGDFNYDGNVNLSDFNRLAANFGLGAAGPDGVTPQDWAALAAAVPEPGATALIGLCGALASRARRRRRGSLLSTLTGAKMFP